MSREKRTLIIEITNSEFSNMVSFTIREQTHRNENFVSMEYASRRGKIDSRGPIRNIFLASNGIEIRSYGCPEWKSDSDTLFVRGRKHEYDAMKCNARRDEIRRIVEAVREYNREFGEDVPMTNFSYEWDELFIIK